MHIWKKIFGTQEESPTIIPNKENTITDTTKNLQTISSLKLTTLIDNVKSIGHPDYPLLRKEYTTTSRMPCTDFSNWVSQQLKDRDYNSLWAFVKTFYNEGDNLQFGIDFSDMIDEVLINTISEKYGVSHADAKKEVEKLNLHDNKNQVQEPSLLRKAFDSFLKKDFRSYIEADDNIILEIQSFFILSNGIDDFNREFWISEGKQAEMLSKVISVFSFKTRLPGFENLIAKANKFLKEMKTDKDTRDYWDDYHCYKIDDVNSIYNLITETDLVNKLKLLSIGERLHFFDYATTYSYRKYWNGDSTYKTRSFGINEASSLEKIISLNIFEIVADIESIPDIISKGELKEKAEQKGFEIKKSWTLDKIFINLKNSDTGVSLLNDIVREKKVLKFKEEYKPDLEKIINRQGEAKIIADLLSMA